ncbi:uncharacterized protein LOC142645274 isoform X1 [Dermatophagoides pteronyssinus]|uniref:uncharacterized protein LOC142645274 isoform X1 n=1 Tax=Dermatophagoides pteronyssinus TaxID=6956 RepID=UPI003F67207C
MSNIRTLILCLAIMIPFLDGTIQLMNKNRLVQDCNSTPSLENVNAQFLVNEVRKFVDDCIKTKDGIRFRKRFQNKDGKLLDTNDMMINQILQRKNSLKDRFIISSPSTTSLPCNHDHCIIQPMQQQQQQHSLSSSEEMDEKMIKKLILFEYLNRF